MTEAADNLAKLEHAYSEWDRTKGKNVDEILDLFDDNVRMGSVLDPALAVSFAGEYVSKDDARQYFAKLLDDWEMISYERDRFISDGDDIVMVGRCHWVSRHGGGEVKTPKVDIWHFENGKVTSFFEMFDTLGFARAAGAL